MNLPYLVLLFFVILSSYADLSKASYQRKLRNDLFKDYVHTIPIGDDKKGITVELKVSLIQLVDVNIQTRVITVEAWIQMLWRDINLIWDKNQYVGLDVIRIDSSLLYKPDIMLYNSANYKEMKDSLVETKALVYSSGKVMWIPPSIFQAICDGIDLTNWPNDVHECHLKFGSWTHDE